MCLYAGYYKTNLSKYYYRLKPQCPETPGFYYHHNPECPETGIFYYRLNAKCPETGDFYYRVRGVWPETQGSRGMVGVERLVWGEIDRGIKQESPCVSTKAILD
jgi:hypothetical protein